MKGARTRLTYGPILAHNLPADATNTKRLYSRRTRRAVGEGRVGAMCNGSDYYGHLPADTAQST